MAEISPSDAEALSRRDTEEDKSAEITTTSAGSGSNSYTSRQKRILVCTLIGSFFAMTSLSLPAPFLPRMDEKHGVNSDLTGWILGVASLVQLLLAPFVGKMVQYTELHTMTVFGLFVSGGATALFGILQYLPAKDSPGLDIEYVVLAFVIRIALSLGNTVFVTASMTLLAITFKDNVTSVMSYSETVIGLGVMTGPALGSAFYSVGGFMGTFAGVGGMIVSWSVVMYFLLPHDIDGRSEDNEPASLREILTDSRVIFGLVLVAFCGIVWASIDPILEPELRNKFELTQELSALSFLLLSVCYAVMAPLVGKCLDSMKSLDDIYVMLFGFVLMMINFLLMGPSPLFPWLNRPLWLLLTCVGVMGVALGFTIVPTFSLLFGSSQSDEEGEEVVAKSTSTNAMISGLWSSAYSIGDFSGPVLSGTVTKLTNFGWTMTAYACGSAAIAVAIVIFKLYHSIKQCRRKSHKLNKLDSNEVNVVSESERQPLLSNT